MSKVTVVVHKRDYTAEVKEVLEQLYKLETVTNVKIVRDMQWNPTISFDIGGVAASVDKHLSPLRDNDKLEFTFEME